MSGSYQKRILRGRIYLFSDALWIIIISFKNITGNYLDIFSVRALGGKLIIMLFPPNFLLMPKNPKIILPPVPGFSAEEAHGMDAIDDIAQLSVMPRCCALYF